MAGNSAPFLRDPAQVATASIELAFSQVPS